MNEKKIIVQGVPYDQSSSFLAGSSSGPAAIRTAFHSPSSNYFTESLIDLQNHMQIDDVGDVSLGKSPIDEIEQQTHSLLESDARLLTLGGDHFITYPVLKAFAGKYGKVNLVQMDAHPDLYDQLDGNRNSHACPFARSHEAGLIDRHIQIGIRTMTAHQQEQVERFGVEVIPIQKEPYTIEIDGPLYVTLDMDVLDPAFAPGVSHYEPGGLSVRDVLKWIHGLKADIVGADIVELNPTRDLAAMTATVAAKFYKELLGVMLSNP